MPKRRTLRAPSNVAGIHFFPIHDLPNSRVCQDSMANDKDASVRAALGADFACLAEYFGAFKVSDILSLSDDELADAARPEHKIAMRLFCRRILQPLREAGPDPYRDRSTRPREPLQGSMLVLRGRVVTASLKSLRPNLLALDSLTAEWRVMDEAKRRQVRWIDVSENFLVDSDLPLLAVFISLFPQREVVDASSSRFYGKDSAGKPLDGFEGAIEMILDCPTMGFLDITSNPLASVDRKDLFVKWAHEKPNLLLKLIWIPKVWLKGGAWKVLVPSDIHAKVYDQHLQYYALRDAGERKESED